MKTILAPLDFSAVTPRVVEAAATLARPLGARIVLLHVVQPPVITADYSLAMETVADIVSVSEKSASKQLGGLQEQLRRDGLEAETVLLTGMPLACIGEQITVQSPDYIVVGSHGHTALYDLLVGSTTHGILKRASCPVMIVPPEK